jgi:hypothetical protein
MPTYWSRVFLAVGFTIIAIFLGLRCRSGKHCNPATVAGIANVPAPPNAVGCYKYQANPADNSNQQWTRVGCLTQGETSRLPHPTIGGPTSGSYGLSGPCAGPCSTNPNSPVTAGSVSVVFPGTGTSLVPVYSAVDSGSGRMSFSVQTNTNTFPVTCHPGSTASGQDACVPGDIGWVQFVYQYDVGPVGIGLFGWGTTSALCVWNADLSQHNFNKSCTGVPLIGGNSNWFKGDVLQIIGGETNQMVWVMACVPWAPGECWSTVAPDVLGLCWVPASSQCAWQTVSGSLLGFGNGSAATFPANVNMLTSVAASACFPPSSYVIGYHPFPPPGVGIMPYSLAAFQCPPPAVPIQNTNGSWLSTFTTLETNNLNPAPANVQSCFEGTCWIQYTASD